MVDSRFIKEVGDVIQGHLKIDTETFQDEEGFKLKVSLLWKNGSQVSIIDTSEVLIVASPATPGAGL